VQGAYQSIAWLACLRNTVASPVGGQAVLAKLQSNASLGRPSCGTPGQAVQSLQLLENINIVKRLSDNLLHSEGIPTLGLLMVEKGSELTS